MGFLNGLGTLASGMGAFTKNSAADEQANAVGAPAAPDALSAPVTAAETPATAPGAAPAAPAAAPGQGVPAGVPPALLPIYEAAARRTGIPVALLVAQGRQESGFDTNAVGKAGEIGLGQIKPSTAAQPGYGMKGIDPATLRDPTVNINFQADYMRARAGPGVDFADPRAVDAALVRYNGGGDANYVANVRRHMGAS